MSDERPPPMPPLEPTSYTLTALQQLWFQRVQQAVSFMRSVAQQRSDEAWRLVCLGQLYSHVAGYVAGGVYLSARGHTQLIADLRRVLADLESEMNALFPLPARQPIEPATTALQEALDHHWRAFEAVCGAK